MISIISYPNKVVGNDGLNISKWNAIHQPVKFQMQRRDFEVTLGKTGASLNVGFNVTASTLVSVNDTIFFSSNSGTYFGTATVTSLSGYNAICTITSGSLPFNQYGFINLDTRENYFIKTKIWGVEGIVGVMSYYELGVSINKPNTKGLANVDVSTYLKSNVNYNNNFDYSKLNWNDAALGGMYNITVSENWNGYEGAFSGISETDLNYYVNSAKQLQDLHGSNMGEYVPFLIYGTGETKAKFLSAFNKPTYFTGFPFDLSFIYSESIWGFEVKKHEQTKNVNGGTVASTSDTLDFYEGVGVHRLMLKEGYASTVKTIDVWLDNSEGGTIPPDPVEMVVGESGYVADGYFQTLTTITVSTANIEAS